jgi:hypothetical protein
MGKAGASDNSRPISVEQIGMQLEMRSQLGSLEIPILQRVGNPKEFVFFALLDGTGQDVGNPKRGLPTTIGHLYEQARDLEDDPIHRIGASYSKGIGAQSNAVTRSLDGVLAYTWQQSIEKSYFELARKAEKWIKEVPDAEIRVVAAGYSRGAVQAVLLQRVIDTYGIANPQDISFGRDANCNVSVISKLPPLVPAGEAAQATLLLDPVATGFPGCLDVRAPGSSVTRVSILASGEGRKAFRHLSVIEPGISPDHRSINLLAPGGHADVGGGNQTGGVEVLTANAVRSVFNSWLDRPLFEKPPILEDASSMKVHQAGGVTAGFGLAMDKDGRRDLREELANCTIVDVCRASEPVNETLASRFEYRRVPMDTVEMAEIGELRDQVAFREAGAAGLGGLRQERLVSTGAPDLDHLMAAIRGEDPAAIDDALLQISHSSDVQAFKQWGREQRAAEPQQEVAQQEAVLHESPAMRR